MRREIPPSDLRDVKLQLCSKRKKGQLNLNCHNTKKFDHKMPRLARQNQVFQKKRCSETNIKVYKIKVFGYTVVTN